MKFIRKQIGIGTHVISVPTARSCKIEDIFPKELSGSTVERLNQYGKWVDKEIILYENNAFVSKNYKKIEALQTLRLTLKRKIVIEWEIDFVSHSGLKESDIRFKEGFEFEEALYLAQLSELVYQEREEIQKTLNHNYSFDLFFYYSKKSHKNLLKRGFIKLLSVFLRSKTPLVDLQFMYLSKRDKSTGKTLLFVIFRGSQEPEDWMTNFNLKDYDFEGRGRVHRGFVQALKLFLKTVKQKRFQENTILEKIENIDHDVQIILAGHSLGGAIATLAGCYLYERGVAKENLEIYTFGAPPVGTKEFTNFYKDKLNIYRVVNENYVVPKLDKITKLCHIGKEILLPSDNGEVHACKGYIDNIIDQIEKER